MKKSLMYVMMLVLAIGLMAGCSGADKNAGDGEKVYKVGTEAAYPPFEKLEAAKIVGLDVDVINAVAEAAGIKIELENTAWDPLFEGVKNGSLDAAISAITITDDRKKANDFTDSYFEATQMIMVPEGSDVKTVKDLKGKKVGVQSSTTGEDAVKKVFGETSKDIKGYDSTPSAVDDLFIGRVDAVVADNAVMQDYLKNYPDKKVKLVKDPDFEIENYGIMVQKGNKELLGKLNDGLKKIKENGKLEEIINKYIDSSK